MTRPVVLFPDAVLVTIEYLRTKLPDSLIYSDVPESRPAEFVRVERVGGARRSLLLDRPRVDFQCWSDSEENAEALVATVRAYALAMGGKRGATTVYEVTEVSGPMWVPDSLSGQARYAFAIEFCTRGTELE